MTQDSGASARIGSVGAPVLAAGMNVEGKFAGVVRENHGVRVDVELSGTEDWICIPKSLCTVVRKPLVVNDVLTEDDPEPPEGTVIFDGHDNVRRLINGKWRWMGGKAAPQDWHAVPKPGSVLHVPKVKS